MGKGGELNELSRPNWKIRARKKEIATAKFITRRLYEGDYKIGKQVEGVVMEKCCENCVYYDTERTDQPCCSCVDWCNFESEVNTKWPIKKE